MVCLFRLEDLHGVSRDSEMGRQNSPRMENHMDAAFDQDGQHTEHFIECVWIGSLNRGIAIGSNKAFP